MSPRITFNPTITKLIDAKPYGGATAFKAGDFLCPHDDCVSVVELSFNLGPEISWSCENWQCFIIEIGLDVAENREF